MRSAKPNFRALAAFQLLLLSGVAIATVLPLASAAAQTAPGTASSLTEAQKLVDQANKALAAGNANLALIQLKNAVRIAPKDGATRARLGAVLLLSNQAIAAERELRQARADNAPDAATTPALLQAMLLRNENEDLLKEFPDPPAGAQDPTTADILNARAIVLQRLGHPADSKAAIDRSLAIRRDGRGLISAAQLAGQRGELSAAQAFADEALKLAPNSDQALAAAVQFGRTARGNDKTLALIDEYLKRSPKSIVAQILKIEQLLALAQDAKAKDQIDAIAKQAPNLPYVPYFRALLLVKAKDNAGAWKLMQNLQPEFVQSDPQIAKAVAAVAATSGNVETAGGILTTLVARHPELTDAKLQLASMRLAQKQPNAAVDVLSTVQAKDDPVVQAVLAQAYLQLGRYNDAIASLEVATSGSNPNDLLKRQLALSELQIGESDQAIRDLKALIAKDPKNTGLNAALIAALLRAGKPDEALSETDRLAKADPKSAVPFFYRGQIYLTRNDLTKAGESFDKAIATDPKFLAGYYYRANISMARGNPDAAKQDLEKIIAQNPASSLAYVRLAQIAADFGDNKTAEDVLNRAIKASPKDVVPRLSLAQLQLSRHNYSEVQSIVNAVLQISPDNPDALTVQGQMQLAQGNVTQAVGTIRRIVQKNANSASAYLMLAGILTAAKDRVGAEGAAARAVELAPNVIGARQALIDTLVGNGKPEDAVATAQSYAKANPGAPADLLVSDTLVRIKRTKDAEAVLTKAMAAKPDSRLAIRLAQMALGAGDSNKAKAILASWLSRHPDDYGVKSARAGLLLGVGDSTGARQAYEELLKQNPNDPAVMNNLGWLIQKEDPKRALALLSRAQKIAPRSAQITDTYGWLKYQSRDAQGALPLVQRAHDLDPNDGAIGYHLAVTLDATGKRPEAKALLKTVLSKSAKFDGSDDAKKLLASW